MDARYECPECLAEIPLADLNVSKDIALCRACGKSFPFSSIGGNSEVTLDALDCPPKSVSVEDDRREGGINIVYKKFSPVVLFLIPFTALWSGVIAWLLYIKPLMKRKMEIFPALFGLPFLLASAVLVCVIVYLLFGKWRISLRGGEGKAFTGVGFIGWTWAFSYNRKTKVSLKPTGAAVNNVPKLGICVQNGEDALSFGSFIADDAKGYIAALILKEAQKSNL